MKKLGILVGIFILIGNIAEADAQCWIEKKQPDNSYITVGKTRPNGNNIDITWIDEKQPDYSYIAVGKVRPNGGDIEAILIDKKQPDNSYKIVGKARLNGGGFDIVWIDKLEASGYVTVGKIRPNSDENCYTQQAVAAAAYLSLLY